MLPILEEFAHLLALLMESGLGARRARVEGLLQQAAELFGNLGAHRGQAAGESVEELQMLREVLIRFLFDDPPRSGSWDLRDLLLLNRFLDVGVAYASVGHTDTLFFNLFHGTGVTDGPTDAVLDEVREQVSGLGQEIGRLWDPDAEGAQGQVT